jgi:tRNA threonylcarbamoyl adenosine modification protein YjeE
MYKYTIDILQGMANDLARIARPPLSILLIGGLGSGKTTFAKFFVRSLLKNEGLNVSSPTFNIVQIYETEDGEVWHADLYRLNNFKDVLEIGLLEAMQENICLIEWPELLTDSICNLKHTKICF